MTGIRSRRLLFQFLGDQLESITINGAITLVAYQRLLELLLPRLKLVAASAARKTAKFVD